MLETGAYKIESESRVGVTYTLTVERRGRGLLTRCSCPGYRRHKHCKHATAAKEGAYHA